jgi:membrane fusion protein (multidrug efflux system)
MKATKRKHRILRWIWGIIPWMVVLAIVVVIVVLIGRVKEKKVQIEIAKKTAIKEEVPAVRVITLTLEPSRLEDKLTLPAEVEPRENLWVKAEVPGQVVEIMVEEGQIIQKGQVLVKLDDRDYRSRLARIQANYKLAKLDYERYVALSEQKIASQSKKDETEARLKDLTAQLTEARLALGRTRITSPISGRLNELKAEKGDFLTMSQDVAQILQFDEVKVTVGVPESDVAAIFDLDEAEVIIEALGNRRVKGKKIFLSRQPRSLARLYNLELGIPNEDGRILPGMFAKVELIKKVYPSALAVPLYAVITQGNDRFVYVEKDGKVEKRPIELGVLMGWEVHVTKGLNPGDHVVVVGHRFLDDGQAVQVIRNVLDPAEILES